MRLAASVLFLALVASPVLAAPHHNPYHPPKNPHGAPAPLIGAGAPLLLAGVGMVAAKLMRRKR